MISNNLPANQSSSAANFNMLFYFSSGCWWICFRAKKERDRASDESENLTQASADSLSSKNFQPTLWFSILIPHLIPFVSKAVNLFYNSLYRPENRCHEVKVDNLTLIIYSDIFKPSIIFAQNWWYNSKVY